MSNKPIHAILLAAAACAGIAACAGNESRQDEVYASARDSREEVVCRRERPVGSHVPVRVCRTKGQMDRDRQAALEEVGMLRTMSGSLPTPPPSRPQN